jgi:hypothetical protein
LGVLTLHSALARAAEHLKVVRVADEEHVSCVCASAVDDAVELQRPRFSSFECGPGLHGIVASGDHYGATRLASREGLQQSGADISAFISLAAVVQDTAGLDLRLGGVGGEWPYFAGKLAQDGGGEKGDGRNEERRELHDGKETCSAGNK